MAIAGTVILLGILISFPFFFAFIEQRPGPVLEDRFLLLIPPADVSIPTFIVIWSMTVLLWVRCVQEPRIFVLFLWCFIVLCFSRMLTISLIPLDPPQGLIPLKDPLSSIFYGGTDKFIQKDLFYSGHTSIQFLMFLTLRKKIDKIVTLLSTLIIATLVLVQHIHYTVDVLAAFAFSYAIYRLVKWITAYE
ncbi:MAG: hypothetical protein JWQ78_1359 [Sediminibacterium sp.]|nr:hypothetical protein [Sediminibacterium sp.]